MNESEHQAPASWASIDHVVQSNGRATVVQIDENISAGSDTKEKMKKVKS